MTDDSRCAAGALPVPATRKPGSACREWDGQHPGWAAHGTPLCESELRVAERDCRTLLWDYLDLEQMQSPTLSQALDTQPAGRRGPPMPLKGSPEALQAEIVHVLTSWEAEVRAAANLSESAARGPNAPWHTTVSKRPPLARVRGGHAVSRAVTVLSPRMVLLGRLGATAVQPAGCEDGWVDVCGWEAVLTLSRLHQRARSMLGRTHRTAKLPGDCSRCGADDLRRDEPRFGPRLAGEPADPCNIYCGHCATSWTSAEYARYVEMLIWPARSAA